MPESNSDDGTRKPKSSRHSPYEQPTMTYKADTTDGGTEAPLPGEARRPGRDRRSPSVGNTHFIQADKARRSSRYDKIKQDYAPDTSASAAVQTDDGQTTRAKSKTPHTRKHRAPSLSGHASGPQSSLWKESPANKPRSGTSSPPSRSQTRRSEPSDSSAQAETRSGTGAGHEKPRGGDSCFSVCCLILGASGGDGGD
jgi:hypothetical protein